MTDTPARPTDPFDPEALNAAEGLDPIDPAYAQVLRVATALNLIPLAIGASVFDYLLIRHVEIATSAAPGQLSEARRITHALHAAQ